MERTGRSGKPLLGRSDKGYAAGKGNRGTRSPRPLRINVEAIKNSGARQARNNETAPRLGVLAQESVGFG